MKKIKKSSKKEAQSVHAFQCYCGNYEPCLTCGVCSGMPNVILSLRDQAVTNTQESQTRQAQSMMAAF